MAEQEKEPVRLRLEGLTREVRQLLRVAEIVAESGMGLPLPDSLKSVAFYALEQAQTRIGMGLSAEECEFIAKPDLAPLMAKVEAAQKSAEEEAEEGWKRNKELVDRINQLETVLSKAISEEQRWSVEASVRGTERDLLADQLKWKCELIKALEVELSSSRMQIASLRDGLEKVGLREEFRLPSDGAREGLSSAALRFLLSYLGGETGEISIPLAKEDLESPGVLYSYTSRNRENNAWEMCLVFRPEWPVAK